MKPLRGTFLFTVWLGGMLIAAAVSSAELYRWVDEDGRVHFSDRPPTAGKAENISGKLGPINSAEATRKRESLFNPSSASIDREYEQRQQKEQQARQQEMEQLCAKARQRLATLNGRVAFIDKNGKEVHVTGLERQEMAKKLQRQIASRCG
ncbi:hypothetical protein Misp06_01122 [Microbulbifer sp. NBRC 101763]|uniref:DUF4124 domain-containing protein n=1 Tax=Microbulbifer sp. NBRC 101763 TaxID=1113820 RepID=UPI0030AB2D7B